MKKGSLLLVVAAVIAFAFLARAQEKTFTGSIMDSQCASMGGHETMYNDELKNPKDCTLACVKEGGTFVLYDVDDISLGRPEKTRAVRGRQGHGRRNL
jgi:hypothetical protein